MLLSTVAETIRRRRMFNPGLRAGVAVSGGADSVCLLHVLRELAPQWNLSLTVLHLNHGLRGDESRQDEQFVRELAAHLGLPSIIQAADVAAQGGNLEQSARQARLAFFHQQLADAHLARIATGHTRDDQAETVLFRFLRGAGGAGLAAIRPVTTDGLVRPLLDAARAQVEQYLRDRGIPWREDSSNASLQFARNRIRRHLLPQLAREWNPAIAEALHRAADWALAEEVYWDAEIARLAAQYLVERDGAVLVRAENLRQLPLAAARRLVRHAIGLVKGDLLGVDFDHIAAIVGLASSTLGHGRAQAPGVAAERSLDWVRLISSVAIGQSPDGYRLPAPIPGVVRVPGTEILISLDMIEKAQTFDPSDSVYNGETGCLDRSTLSGALELRNWRPGDRYRPTGSTGEEKIKTLFQKARIPRWERRQWPVLTAGAVIVWARQFGAAVDFAACPASAQVLRIREV